MSLDFLKRPEFVTILVALVISALAATGVGVCAAPPESPDVLMPETVSGVSEGPAAWLGPQGYGGYGGSSVGGLPTAGGRRASTPAGRTGYPGAAEPAACVPQTSVQEIVTVFWAIFVGAVVEGKYKGINYSGNLWQILSGSKFRLGALAFVIVVVNALLQPLGYALSPDSIHAIANIILAAIGLKTAGDVAGVVVGPR